MLMSALASCIFSKIYIVWFLMKDTKTIVDLIPVIEKFTISLKESMYINEFCKGQMPKEEMFVGRAQRREKFELE